MLRVRANNYLNTRRHSIKNSLIQTVSTIALLLGMSSGTPTELAYDNGPHPRLIIYLDFRDAVGRWWVIPLQ